MKILYVSQYFPPEMGAPSARVYELSRRWIENGVDVTILTGFPNHPTGEIPKNYKGYRFLKEEKDGIKIIRTYTFATPNKGFVKRILSYLTFMFSSIIQGTRVSGKQDVIIASSPQFFVGVAGYIISRIKGIPFVFEIRDLWPESIVQLGVLRNKLIIKILEKIEFFLYMKSDKIIAVADSTVEVLTGRGVLNEKISVIKNGVDLDLFKNKLKKEFFKDKYRYKEKFVVSYIGTHGLSHALDNVLEAAELLKEKTDIIFLLVGEGAEKEKLKSIAKKNHITNVFFIDQIKKSQLPDYYALSDIVLVTLRKLPLFKKVIPSKIFEIMAMKCPIIISVDGEARALIERAEAGIFSEPENPIALKNAILKLYKDSVLCNNYGNNGRLFVEKYFDRNILADKYLDIIKEVV